jgi:hypothetical protein
MLVPVDALQFVKPVERPEASASRASDYQDDTSHQRLADAGQPSASASLAHPRICGMLNRIMCELHHFKQIECFRERERRDSTPPHQKPSNLRI